ncbi:MAG: NAD-binding protein [Phycisphaerales bacterium]|nr:NAD-binding protein [Phycisphaerales bacterium]
MLKILSAQILTLTSRRRDRRNVAILSQFIVILVVLVLVYSGIFQALMHLEGQEHTFIDGVYWTLVTMSTLGFGDITFRETPGRVFSIVVILTGTIFMLTLLPFAFIQFFYSPWMESRRAAIAPRALPPETRDHVILTNYGALNSSLVRRLVRAGTPHAVIVPDIDEAIRLHDQGISVMLGEPDNPETYRAARADQAGLIIATLEDAQNAAAALAAHSVCGSARIVTVTTRSHAEKVCQAAGSTHVLQLARHTGVSLANRIVGGDAMTHVIGSLDALLIAEANALRTPLVGKTLRENRLNELGVMVVGVWDRGVFQPAGPDTMITSSTILVLAGTREQLDRYDEEFSIYNVSSGHVIIIGAGRVGAATARALETRGVEFRIIERIPKSPAPSTLIEGDASDPEVLAEAGLAAAHAVVITTHDDTINIYLTILIRHLRPDIQIISRSSLERSVEALHRAGADFVVSTASVLAGFVMNLLRDASMLMLAEGMTIFRFKVHGDLEGHTLAQLDLRRRAGCSVLAVYADGQMHPNPSASHVLTPGSELLVIGGTGAEERLEAVSHAGLGHSAG